MNLKKGTIGRLLLLTLLISVLAGCINKGPYNEKEEEEVIKTLIAQATSGETTVEEYENLIDIELPRLSKEGAAEIIDSYLYVVFHAVDEMDEMAPAFQKEASIWFNDNKDIKKQEDLKTVSNSMFKSYLEELKSARLKIVELDGMYIAQPEYAIILEKYKAYMTDVMIEYIELSMEEVENPFYDVLTENVDLELLGARIVRVMDMQKNFPDSIYSESLLISESYYREVYFGWNNDFLVGLDDKVRPEMLESYKKQAEEYKEHAFGEELAGLIALLEKSENEVTEPVTDYLEFIVHTKFEKGEKVTEEVIEEPKKEEIDNEKEVAEEKIKEEKNEGEKK